LRFVSIDADQFENLRDALQKLKLNDAALHYEPETSSAMGFGPLWFLGCCMEIAGTPGARVQPDLIITAPSQFKTTRRGSVVHR